jgi:membrane-bound lytic murein transglycosylase D
MQLKSFFRCLTGMAAIFVMCFTPLHSQTEEPDIDIAAPIDTTEETQLVAKGPVVNAPITDAAVRERLSYLSGCLDLRTDAVVRSYIRHYVHIKTEKTRGMLGRRLTYFPLFEQKLREYGLPSDLKYLSVVESALNPKAVSRVGATGLWQFMPATGSDYGLRTNSAVEERSDPVKSTDAAMRYLRDLFKQYNDWALALAAYNSGPTRVNAAIRRSGSRNFWRLQRFLPEETRNYVPAFIAATYICNYFTLHNINPHYPDLDQQLTSYIKIYEGISFRDISDVTGTSYADIKTLNPGFQRGYVPPSTNGHFVVLPQRVMPAFVRYLNTLGVRVYIDENNADYGNADTGDGRYWKGIMTADRSESLESLAFRIGLSPDHLKTWNGVTQNYVNAGQALAIWHPVYIQQHQKVRITAPVQDNRIAMRENPGTPVSQNGQRYSAPTLAPVAPRREESPRTVVARYHTMRRNESLEDVARQYNSTVENLRQLNRFESLKPGMRVRLRAGD